MRLKSIAFLFFIISSSIAGNTWSTTFETGDDLFYGLRDGVVLPNGSTVISIAGPFENPFLICLDREGEILWYRHILEFEDSRAFESNGSLVALEDGFAACFHSEPRATGINTDIAVVRLNSSGEIIWTYILGETDEAVWMSTDIIACSDGGVLVTGCPGMQLPGGFAFKLSSDGRQEWITQTEIIPGFALSASETGNGEFLILSVDEYSNCTVVQHVSSNGLVSSPHVVAETMIQFTGKLKYINGSLWVYSPAEGNTVQAFRLDEDFNPIQTFEIQLPQDYEAGSADILEDGFLVSGGTEDGNALLAMYGFDGSLIWEKQYNTGGIDFLYSATYLDEGILAFGHAQQFLNDFSVFLLLKADHSGYVEGASVNENGTLLIESEALCVDLLSPGWLVACSILSNEDDAVSASADIMEQTGLKTGYLWIPDWQSLSGTNGWLVYAIPGMETEGSLEDGFAALLELHPDTYFIWVSQGWERNVMSIEDFLLDR
ncbi:MAG: hypothetical protein K8R76_09700 [Candidatus Aegiribacteria sp.]|nr:hypothetical protein [Candidatus Aegiribacteria sp.]